MITLVITNNRFVLNPWQDPDSEKSRTVPDDLAAMLHVYMCLYELLDKDRQDICRETKYPSL